MKSIGIVAGIFLFFFSHVASATWTASGSLIETKDFRTKAEAEAYLKGNVPFFSKLTSVNVSTSQGKIRYSYRSGHYPGQWTQWGYFSSQVMDPNTTPTPSGLEPSYSALVSKIENWYPTWRTGSCRGTGIENTGAWLPGVGGGGVPDEWLTGRGTLEERKHQILTFWFWSEDGSNACTIRLTSQDAGISALRFFYCPDLDADPGSDGAGNSSCGYPTWAEIAGEIETCHTPQCREYVGNPIQAITGEKIYSKIDSVVDGVGFARTYSSSAKEAVSNFSQNWTHTFSSKILSVAAYLGPTGRWCKLIDQGQGYACADDDSIRMSYVNGSLKEVRKSNAYVESFDGDGNLFRVRYLNGVVVDIERDSLKRIESLRFSTGRRINFHYSEIEGAPMDSGGVISSIDFPDGTIVYSHDALGRLTSVTYSDGSQLSYKYENVAFDNLLTSVVDESGSTYAIYAYDAKGRATSSNSGGLKYTVAYNDANSTSTVTEPSGKRSTYSGSTEGLWGISPESAALDSEKWTYTWRGVASYSRGRWALSYSRDSNGQVIEEKEAVDGVVYRKRQYEWDPVSPVKTVERTLSGSGSILNYLSASYNELGQALTRVLHASAGGTDRTIASTYCQLSDVNAGNCPIIGLLLSVDGPIAGSADVTTYSYRMADEASCAVTPATCLYRKGDLWKITDGLGHVTERLAYDAAGRPLSIKDANGVVTDYAYTSRGWLVSVKVRGTNASSETDDRITKVEYWPTGLVRKMILPDGTSTIYTYDSAQRLIRISDNASNTISFVLDNAGNRIKEDTKDAAGSLKRTLSRIYNDLGQLRTQADAQANPTDFTYDTSGNLDTVTDALGRKTDNDYDPLGRLSQTLQDATGLKAKSIFAYDPLDNLTQVTDPKGIKTTYVYDGLGNLTSLVSPDTGTTTYEYDGAGNRLKQTDARAIVTTYTYDALSRLVKVAAGSDVPVVYSYDVPQSSCASGENFGIGRLTKMADGSGSTFYCYNRFGDLVRKVQTTNGVSLTVKYAYSAKGQLTSLTYPDGSVLSYTYGALGRPAAVKVTPSGFSQQTLLSSVSYAPFGPVTSWTYGNGRKLDRAYNQDYQPTAIQDTAVGGLNLGFGYDPVGSLVTLTTAGSNSPVVNFAYDALSRLTQVKDGPTGTPLEVYTYDAGGNRSSFKNTSGTQTYSYSSTSHRLSSVAGVVRTYDAAGNTTAIGGASKSLIYNNAGRLAQVSSGGVLKQSYIYNGKGEQVRRFLGSTNTYTVYDEAGQWLGDYDGSGAPLQQALWMDNAPVGVLAGPKTSVDRLRYVESDHMGSPRSVIDPARNISIWRWDMKGELFGNTFPNEDPDADGVTVTLNMRFPGQRYDHATGLNYNYFRDYEPASGRYVQSDPIGLNGGLSTYGYAGQRPLTLFDPLGLDSPIFYAGQYRMPAPHAINPRDYNDSVTALGILSALDAEMKRRNIGGADQFYHCLGACRATQATNNAAIVLELMSLKEVKDYYAGRIGFYGDHRRRTHSEMQEDNNADLAVNKYGASCETGEDCARRCMKLVPDRALKFLSNYIPEWAEK